MTTAEIDGATTGRARVALTPRQQEMCDFIRSFTTRKGFGPSLQEIADALNITSRNGVLCHLRSMERKGILRRDPKTSRSIVLLEAGPPGEPGRLRDELQSLLDRLAVVRPEGPDVGDICYAAYYSRSERDRIKVLLEAPR